jgi:protein gp37
MKHLRNKYMIKNYINPTKIEWCQRTWNPIVGCKRNCSYCYAKVMNKRFKLIPDWNEPVLFEERLVGPSLVKKPKTIFVGSMCDLMAPWMPNEWIERIIHVMEENHHHTFMLLTKDPYRYKEFRFPPNVHLGVTLDDSRFKHRLDELREYDNSRVIKFASVEPILSDMSDVDFSGIDTVIIGAETGRGAKKPDPNWVLSVDHPNVFLKDSLFKLEPDLTYLYRSAREVPIYPLIPNFKKTLNSKAS